jgi:hypothetical protein
MLTGNVTSPARPFRPETPAGRGQAGMPITRPRQVKA